MILNFPMFARLVEAAFLRGLALVALVLVLALAYSVAEAGQDGQRSPTRTILEVVEKVPSLDNRFARISFPLPQNADILDAEIRRGPYWWNHPKGRRILFTVAVDDSEPMVWRAVALVVPPHFETSPPEALIGVESGIVIYDLGDFAEPPPP